MDNSLKLLADLKCSQCNQYLSRSPVYLKPNGTSICHRCFLPNPELTRNKSYEAAAKLLKFPCENHIFGCKKLISFVSGEDRDNHENCCEYRQYCCPIMGPKDCNWTGTKNELVKHCDGCNASRCLPNPCHMSLDVNKAGEYNFVIHDFGTFFLLQVKVSTGYIYHGVQCLSDSEASTKFFFTLQVKRNSSFISKEGQIQSFGSPILDESKCIVLNIDSLKDIFGGLEENIFTVTIIEKDCECDESEKTSNNLNALKLSLIDIDCEKCNRSFISEDETDEQDECSCTCDKIASDLLKLREETMKEKGKQALNKNTNEKKDNFKVLKHSDEYSGKRLSKEGINKRKRIQFDPNQGIHEKKTGSIDIDELKQLELKQTSESNIKHKNRNNNDLEPFTKNMGINENIAEEMNNVDSDKKQSNKIKSQKRKYSESHENESKKTFFKKRRKSKSLKIDDNIEQNVSNSESSDSGLTNRTENDTKINENFEYQARDDTESELHNEQQTQQFREEKIYDYTHNTKTCCDCHGPKKIIEIKDENIAEINHLDDNIKRIDKLNGREISSLRKTYYIDHEQNELNYLKNNTRILQESVDEPSQESNSDPKNCSCDCHRPNRRIEIKNRNIEEINHLDDNIKLIDKQNDEEIANLRKTFYVDHEPKESNNLKTNTRILQKSVDEPPQQSNFDPINCSIFIENKNEFNESQNVTVTIAVEHKQTERSDQMKEKNRLLDTKAKTVLPTSTCNSRVKFLDCNDGENNCMANFLRSHIDPKELLTEEEKSYVDRICRYAENKNKVEKLLLKEDIDFINKNNVKIEETKDKKYNEGVIEVIPYDSTSHIIQMKLKQLISNQIADQVELVNAIITDDKQNPTKNSMKLEQIDRTNNIIKLQSQELVTEKIDEQIKLIQNILPKKTDENENIVELLNIDSKNHIITLKLWQPISDEIIRKLALIHLISADSFIENDQKENKIQDNDRAVRNESKATKSTLNMKGRQKAGVNKDDLQPKNRPSLVLNQSEIKSNNNPNFSIGNDDIEAERLPPKSDRRASSVKVIEDESNIDKKSIIKSGDSTITILPANEFESNDIAEFSDQNDHSKDFRATLEIPNNRKRSKSAHKTVGADSSYELYVTDFEHSSSDTLEVDENMRKLNSSESIKHDSIQDDSTKKAIQQQLEEEVQIGDKVGVLHDDEFESIDDTFGESDPPLSTEIDRNVIQNTHVSLKNEQIPEILYKNHQFNDSETEPEQDSSSKIYENDLDSTNLENYRPESEDGRIEHHEENNYELQNNATKEAIDRKEYTGSTRNEGTSTALEEEAVYTDEEKEKMNSSEYPTNKKSLKSSATDADRKNSEKNLSKLESLSQLPTDNKRSIDNELSTKNAIDKSRNNVLQEKVDKRYQSMNGESGRPSVLENDQNVNQLTKIFHNDFEQNRNKNEKNGHKLTADGKDEVERSDEKELSEKNEQLFSSKNEEKFDDDMIQENTDEEANKNKMNKLVDNTTELEMTENVVKDADLEIHQQLPAEEKIRRSVKIRELDRILRVNHNVDDKVDEKINRSFGENGTQTIDEAQEKLVAENKHVGLDDRKKYTDSSNQTDNHVLQNKSPQNYEEVQELVIKKNSKSLLEDDHVNLFEDRQEQLDAGQKQQVSTADDNFRNIDKRKLQKHSLEKIPHENVQEQTILTKNETEKIEQQKHQRISTDDENSSKKERFRKSDDDKFEVEDLAKERVIHTKYKLSTNDPSRKYFLNTKSDASKNKPLIDTNQIVVYRNEIEQMVAEKVPEQEMKSKIIAKCRRICEKSIYKESISDIVVQDNFMKKYVPTVICRPQTAQETSAKYSTNKNQGKIIVKEIREEKIMKNNQRDPAKQDTSGQKRVIDENELKFIPGYNRRLSNRLQEENKNAKSNIQNSSTLKQVEQRRLDDIVQKWKLISENGKRLDKEGKRKNVHVKSNEQNGMFSKKNGKLELNRTVQKDLASKDDRELIDKKKNELTDYQDKSGKTKLQPVNDHQRKHLEKSQNEISVTKDTQERIHRKHGMKEDNQHESIVTENKNRFQKETSDGETQTRPGDKLLTSRIDNHKGYFKKTAAEMIQTDSVVRNINKQQFDADNKKRILQKINEKQLDDGKRIADQEQKTTNDKYKKSAQRRHHDQFVNQGTKYNKELTTSGTNQFDTPRKGEEKRSKRMYVQRIEKESDQKNSKNDKIQKQSTNVDIKQQIKKNIDGVQIRQTKLPDGYSTITREFRDILKKDCCKKSCCESQGNEVLAIEQETPEIEERIKRCKDGVQIRQTKLPDGYSTITREFRDILKKDCCKKSCCESESQENEVLTMEQETPETDENGQLLCEDCCKRRIEKENELLTRESRDVQKKNCCKKSCCESQGNEVLAIEHEATGTDENGQLLCEECCKRRIEKETELLKDRNRQISCQFCGKLPTIIDTQFIQNKEYLSIENRKEQYDQVIIMPSSCLDCVKIIQVPNKLTDMDNSAKKYIFEEKYVDTVSVENKQIGGTSTDKLISKEVQVKMDLKPVSKNEETQVELTENLKDTIIIEDEIIQKEMTNEQEMISLEQSTTKSEISTNQQLSKEDPDDTLTHESRTREIRTEEKDKIKKKSTGEENTFASKDKSLVSQDEKSSKRKFRLYSYYRENEEPDHVCEAHGKDCKNCSKHFFLETPVGTILYWYSRKYDKFLVNLYTSLPKEELRDVGFKIKCDDKTYTVCEGDVNVYKISNTKVLAEE